MFLGAFLDVATTVPASTNSFPPAQPACYFLTTRTATLLPPWLPVADKTSVFPPFFFFSSSLLFLAPFSIHPTQHYAASIIPPSRQPIDLHNRQHEVHRSHLGHHGRCCLRHFPSRQDPHQGVQSGSLVPLAGDMHRVERNSGLGPPQALGYAHHHGVRDWPCLADRHLRDHHRWKADRDDQLQDLDLDARNHLDQHLLLHSDFDQQALQDLEQVVLDQLQVQDLFRVDLDSLQLHQDFLQVHSIVQAVDQLQVHHFCKVDQLQVQDQLQVVQHSLHNLVVVLDQALRAQLDIFEVHQHQAFHFVLPGYDLDFHQLDIHHRDCAQPCLCHVFGSQLDLAGLARHRDFVVGVPLFRPSPPPFNPRLLRAPVLRLRLLILAAKPHPASRRLCQVSRQALRRTPPPRPLTSRPTPSRQPFPPSRFTTRVPIRSSRLLVRLPSSSSATCCCFEQPSAHAQHGFDVSSMPFAGVAHDHRP
ncbi:hypothetical protein Q7P35_002518 [Cladosporium inversicolor]